MKYYKNILINFVQYSSLYFYTAICWKN